MKPSIILLIAGALLINAAPCSASASVVVEDSFSGSASVPPDETKFEWNGEVAQNGAGQLGFGTWTADQSWLRSKAGAASGLGQTLVLQMRAAAYAEGWNPGVYGDGQPRGLRVGNDANNAIEFYSASRTSVGLRMRKDGVESLAACELPSGVDSMHDYEIAVTPTSVCFKVDGVLAGTFTVNMPTGVLNVYVSTHDGGGVGNVPVTIDSLSLSLDYQSVAAPSLAVAWGYNNYGQTTVPSELSNVVALAAGYEHTVALKNDGTLRAWGNNYSGQANIAAGLSNVTAIAAGFYHTVALQSDGTVTAWGWNESGQTNIPAGLSKVTAIAAGYGHTVALRSDGTVTAWGNNYSGQTDIPVGLSNVTAIAAGYEHTVALRSDGKVTAWGNNDSGQRTVPAGLSNVVAIGASGYRTVALKSDSKVTAWGDNSSGQTTVPAGLSNVMVIAASEIHTVALRSNGTMLAWGYNHFGQTTIPLGLSNVTAIAAGGYHTVALASQVPPIITTQPILVTANVTSNAAFTLTATGTAPLSYQWRKDGVNLSDATNAALTLSNVQTNLAGNYTVVITSALGSVTSSVAVLTVTRLVQTIGLGPLPCKRIDDAPFLLNATTNSGLPVNYTSSNPRVATVAGNTVAITGIGGTTITASREGDATYLPATVSQPFWVAAMPGTVVAWGDNSSGQRIVPADLTHVTAVSAGYWHSVALKTNGTVTAWGTNNLGQTTVPAGLSNVTAMAAGGYHTVALKLDGTVTAWGGNGAGQTSIPAGLSNNVTAIAAGGNHSVALKSDGTVTAWGDNSCGQLNGPGLSTVTAIAAGYGHTVALKSNGTVTAWGYNNHEQTTVPASLSNVTAIAAGGFHTVALKSDGTVTAWGYNGTGQRTVPAGLSNVTGIAAGYLHTVALKSDGTMVAWGNNDFGQNNFPVGLSRVTSISGGWFHTVALASLVTPSVGSFAPTSGPVGTSVTINGTNFIGVTSVKFNGVNAAFTVVSDVQIVATVPGANSSGLITLSNLGATAIGSNIFTVTATVITACDEASLDAVFSNNVRDVSFACEGTIEITTTKEISSDLTLDATGHTMTIGGSNTVRVFTVNPGVHLTLRNLTIANGNCATLAGGIYNHGGIVTLVDCILSNNAVVGVVNGNGSGGAIYNDNNGSLILTNCTFANNRATGGTGFTGAAGGGTGGCGGYGYGGGIYNHGGTVGMVNCTFNSNQAIGGVGGTGGRGVDGYQYWRSISWPSAGWPGYWVTVYGGPGGRGGDGGNGFGGSLHNSSGTATLVNVTMARGSAIGGNGGSPGSPGDYYSGSYGPGYFGNNSRGGNLCIASGSVAAKNTILAYGNGSPGYNCSGPVMDSGNNICSDTTANFSMTGSLNNRDPLLATDLSPNAGLVMTLALLSQSPAINAGDDDAAPTTDQRHFSRAGLSDVGAYEFQTPASVISYTWLQGYGLATDGSGDQTDSDGDGVNNLGEWIAGTNPTDVLSCLKMLPQAGAESGLAVRWQSVSGKIYWLQRSTELGAMPPFSTVQSNIVGQPGTTLYIDTNAVGSGPFFYRVAVQQ